MPRLHGDLGAIAPSPSHYSNQIRPHRGGRGPGPGYGVVLGRPGPRLPPLRVLRIGASIIAQIARGRLCFSPAIWAIFRAAPRESALAGDDTGRAATVSRLRFRFARPKCLLDVHRGIPNEIPRSNCLVVFGLSALRFIVAVCFFFDFDASIRLFVSLTNCPRSKSPPLNIELNLREWGVELYVCWTNTSGCCELETASVSPVTLSHSPSARVRPAGGWLRSARRCVRLCAGPFVDCGAYCGWQTQGGDGIDPANLLRSPARFFVYGNCFCLMAEIFKFPMRSAAALTSGGPVVRRTAPPKERAAKAAATLPPAADFVALSICPEVPQLRQSIAGSSAEAPCVRRSPRSRLP